MSAFIFEAGLRSSFECRVPVTKRARRSQQEGRATDGTPPTQRAPLTAFQHTMTVLRCSQGARQAPSSKLGSVQTGLLSRADVDTTAPTQQASSTAYQQHIDGTEQGGRCRQASSSKLGSVQTSLSSPVQLSLSPHRHNMHRQQSISSTLAVPRCSDAAAKPLPRN